MQRNRLSCIARGEQNAMMEANPQLKQLFSQLDEWEGPIPLTALEDWLQIAPLQLHDVSGFVRFGADRYQRNLMYDGPNYHALILCWRSGQRSPIHDHIGSACAVKVLQGTAIETIFERAPNGMAYATLSRSLDEGHKCASQDRDIHQISNLQPAGQDLITFHLYSPPLHSMNVYSIVEPRTQRYFDPINEDFTFGSGI